MLNHTLAALAATGANLNAAPGLVVKLEELTSVIVTTAKLISRSFALTTGAAAAMSVSRIMGLVGVSMWISRVLGFTAARMASARKPARRERVPRTSDCTSAASAANGSFFVTSRG